MTAGTPIETIQDIIDTEEILEKMAGTGEFFGIMNPCILAMKKIDEKPVRIIGKMVELRRKF